MKTMTGQRDIGKKITAWLTLGLFVVQPVLTLAAPIAADPQAPGKYRPLVQETASGVPLVNITTPNGSGVSRNQYTDFSVPQKGAILNNAAQMSQTQLAGYVQGNPNLATGAASVIVNEVTSLNPSYLNGFTEIAGSKASLVIANPNGIRVNGGGFLNTSRALLTTGRPEYDPSGNLESLRVTKGTVDISGQGLDASRTDRLDILARAVSINAGVWAKEANLRTGPNLVRYEDNQATPISGEGEAPQVALDIAAIGGMYANRITMVGTEQGLGVNMTGRMSGQKAVSLDVDGHLGVSGTVEGGTVNLTSQTYSQTGGAVQGSSDVTVSAKEITVDKGTLASNGNVTLQAEDQASLTASTIGTDGNLVVQAGNQAALTASTLGAKGDLSVMAGQRITTSDGTKAAGRTTTVAAKDVTNNNSTLTSREGTLIQAEEALTNTNGGIIGSEQNLAIRNQTGSTADLTVTNEGSTLAAGKDLNITAQHMALDGTIQADGSIDVKAADSLTAAGTLQAGKSLSLTTAGDITNQTEIQAGNNLSIAAAGNVVNNGTLQAGDTAAITAKAVSNTGAAKIYGTTIAISADSLSNTADSVKEEGLLQAAQITAQKKAAMEEALTTLSQVIADQDQQTEAGKAAIAAANASYQAAKTEFLEAQASAQTLYDDIHQRPAGTIAARDGMQIEAKTVTNTIGALLHSDGDMTITGQNGGEAVSVTNRGGTIEAGTSLGIKAAAIRNENAQLSFGIEETDWAQSEPDRITAWGSDAAGSGEGHWIDDLRSRVPGAGEEGASTGSPQIINQYTVHPDKAGQRTELKEVYTAKGQRISTNYEAWDSSDWQQPGITELGITPPAAPPKKEDFTARLGRQAGETAWTEAYAAWQQSYDRTLKELSEKLVPYNKEVHEDNLVLRFEDYTLSMKKAKTITPTLISSAPGTMQAGGSLTLEGETTNQDSTIVAGGALTAKGSVDNLTTTAQKQTLRQETIVHSEVVAVGLFGNRKSRHNHTTTADAAPELTAAELPTGTYQDYTATPIQAVDQPGLPDQAAGEAARTVTGQIGRSIPNASLYAVHPESTASYLIETDAQFTNKKNFLSSDYMYRLLAWDPDHIQKRLGDGYYEQQLLRQQIVELTGQRYLNGYTSDEEEYRQLLANGAAYVKAYGLQPGISLSPEQMAALTSDLVLLVSEPVTLPNGQQEMVLVPRVYLKGGSAKAITPEGALIAGSTVVMDLKQNLTNEGSILGQNGVAIQAGTLVSDGLISGNTVQLSAAQNMTIGGKVVGEQAVILSSASDLTVAPDTYRTGTAGGAYRTGLVRTAGIAVTGEEGVLVASADRDLTLSAAGLRQLGKGGATLLSAGRDLQVGTIRTTDYAQGIQDDNNYLKTMNIQDVGTRIAGTGDVQLQAGQNLTAKGAQVTSETGAVNVLAKGNVSLTAGEAVSDRRYALRYKESGLLSSTTTTIREDTYQQQAVGTLLSGETVQVQAGNDIQVTAGTIVGTNDVRLAAGHNLTTTSAEEVTKNDRLHQVKTSGIMGSGMGILIGTKEGKDRNEGEQHTQAATVIGAANGTVTLSAGDTIHATTTDIVGKDGITLTAQDMLLDGKDTTSWQRVTHEERQSGLSVGLGGSVVTALDTASQYTRRAGRRQDKRLAALELYEAKKEIGKGINSLDAYMSQTNQTRQNQPVSLRISIGSSSSKAVYENTSAMYDGGSLTSDQAITLSAQSGSEEKGNLAAVGETIQGRVVNLLASRDMSLSAGTTTNTSKEDQTSSGWSLGTSLGLSGGGLVGIDASGHRAYDKGVTTQTTYAPTTVTGTEAAVLKSGRDIALTGSAVAGQTVTVDAGRNLTVESLQETEIYRGDRKSSGFSVSTDIGRWHPDVSVSASKGKTDSTYASVAEQAGIYAGTGGFAITTGDTTTLKGAVLASEADPAKNSLTTGNLRMTDIENRAAYKDSSVGLTYNRYADYDQMSPKQKDDVYNEKGLLPSLLPGAQGKASSTTRSAIAPGTILVTGEQMNVQAINRNTVNSLNQLDRIFDKTKIEERQELARLFAKDAFEQLHHWNPTTASDKAAKAAAHGLVAEMAARLAGNPAGSGFAAGAANELMVQRLDRTLSGHPDVAQGISAILGAAINRATGKPGQAGAAVAQYGTKWNNGIIAVDMGFLSPEQNENAQKWGEYQLRVVELIEAKAALGGKRVADLHGIPAMSLSSNLTIDIPFTPFSYTRGYTVGQDGKYYSSEGLSVGKSVFPVSYDQVAAFSTLGNVSIEGLSANFSANMFGFTGFAISGRGISFVDGVSTSPGVAVSYTNTVRLNLDDYRFTKEVGYTIDNSNYNYNQPNGLFSTPPNSYNKTTEVNEEENPIKKAVKDIENSVEIQD